MPLKYSGQGDAILGFPARDLTDEEILKYAKRFLLNTGLYIEVKDESIQPGVKQKSAKESDK